MKITLFIFLLLTKIPVFAGNPIKIFDSFNQIETQLIPREDTTLFINFWASWCRPCVEELPAIEKVRIDLNDKKVKFLLVCLDDPAKLQTSVIPLIDRLNIHTSIILLDDTDYNSWIDRIDPAWTGAIPGSLIINKNGKKFYEKSFTYQELSETIYKHLIQ